MMVFGHRDLLGKSVQLGSAKVMVECIADLSAFLCKNGVGLINAFDKV